MKIKYEFATNDVSEVEVNDELGKEIIEIERAEYNNNRRETRRHNSYNDDNDKMETLMDTKVNIVRDVEMKICIEDLEKAIKMLQEQQQELINKLFFQEQSMAEIAREEGVSSKAIQDRISKIKNRLRKIIEQNLK